MDTTNTTYTILRHSYGNAVEGVKIMGDTSARLLSKHAPNCRRNFIDDITSALRRLREGGIQEEMGVGEDELQELLTLAERHGDWTQPYAIQALDEAYQRICGPEL